VPALRIFLSKFRAVEQIQVVAAEASSKTLAALRPGARARVQRVEADGPLGQRLLDLGFLPGTEVRAIRRAPLGDPAVYELRGTQLCLRRSEAKRIRVVPLADEPRG
jgi:ferrous iron transport protein A